MQKEKHMMIIWDWDNTLADTVDAIHSALNTVAKMNNQPPITLSETLRIIGVGGVNYWRKYYQKDVTKVLADFWTAYAKNARLVRPMAGATELLQWCKDKGFISVVNSNKRGTVLREECAALGWNDFFTALVGIGDTPYDKPDKRMIAPVLKRTAYSHLFVIGDGASDMQVAKNVDGISILVNDIIPDSADFKGLNIDFDCQNLSQVKVILEQALLAK